MGCRYRSLIKRALKAKLFSVNLPDTDNILRGLRDKYEGIHGVRIRDQALLIAAQLSSQYITGRRLPDKAIDLVDEACANVRVQVDSQPQEIDNLERKRIQVEGELHALEKEKDKASKARLVEVRKEVDDLGLERYHSASVDEYGALHEIEVGFGKLEGSIGENSVLVEAVGREQIAEVVSHWTGIPVTILGENEKERLIMIGLGERLHKRVVGQDQAHSVSRLVKPPPGYVGHEESGQPTEAVRRRPHSVILFDEVEKAHTSVFNTLLQVLDDGRLTDGQGRKAVFNNSVIIMTSNLGAEHLLAGLFGKCTTETARERVMQEVKKHFRPELLNRLDEIVEISRISDERRASRLAEKGISLAVSDAALDIVLTESYDPVYGARPIEEMVREESGDRVVEDAC
ncbi:hypothetical protein MKW92_009593 [Papaver armeniacum]|nr:hypothetical protein MKW92_009593 [Papaver armeniacum]